MIDWLRSDVVAAGALGLDLSQFIANSTLDLKTPGIGTDPSSANSGY